MFSTLSTYSGQGVSDTKMSSYTNDASYSVLDNYLLSATELIERGVGLCYAGSGNAVATQVNFTNLMSRINSLDGVMTPAGCAVCMLFSASDIAPIGGTQKEAGFKAALTPTIIGIANYGIGVDKAPYELITEVALRRQAAGKVTLVCGALGLIPGGQLQAFTTHIKSLDQIVNSEARRG